MPPGVHWCPSCGKLNASPRVRLIFVAMIALIVLGTVLTGTYVAYLKRFESSLAQEWFRRGEEAMSTHRPDLAVEDYRNALSYEGSSSLYRLKLAEALMANGHLPEARAYLLSVWSQAPADAEVNLDLARLYALENNPEVAIRYYRMAVDGVWNENALQRRIDARLELVHYLLQGGDRARATAELIALQAEAPDSPESQLTVGNLMLQLGDNSRAHKAFDAVLKQRPENIQAWSGEGKAALAMGDYRGAIRAFSEAVSRSGEKPDSSGQQELALAREAFDADPSLRTLSLTERAARIASAFDLAMKRLKDCATREGVSLSASPPPKAATSRQRSPTAAVAPATPSPSPLQLLYASGSQRRAAATAASLHNNPDAMAPTMEFVDQVFRATEEGCPPQTLREQALQLLAHHEYEELR
jgi:tetratricopeptide (TPR) repeat protein